MLELAGVRRSYRGAGLVLRGVDLRVAAGRPCVVHGANGSGKSTLLRVAAGVTTPSAGRVTGRPAVVGYLPAPFPTSSRLPVATYLRRLAAMRGLGRPGVARAEALLTRLGFTGARDGTVAELSTGNAQKVGLAQALCGPPGLVVLDEPWTGLDADAGEALARHLGELAPSVPLLLADHTARAARLPGARPHVLHDGVLSDAAVAADPRTEVEVWCPDGVVPPERPAPVSVSVSGERCGRRVRVVLRRAHGDAWVAAALARGCSLVLVRHGDGGRGSGHDEDGHAG